MVSGAGPLNKTINSVVGGYLENAQTPDWTAAKVKAQAVATELGKAFKGAGVLSEKEIGDWKHNIAIATSPDAMKAAASSAISLAVGRADALQSHWDKTMGPNNQFQVMDPEAQAAFDRVLQWSRGEIGGDQLKSKTAPAKSAGGPLAPPPANAGVPPPGAAPPIGFIQDGYRYKGGNPNDPKSWQPAAAGDRS